MMTKKLVKFLAFIINGINLPNNDESINDSKVYNLLSKRIYIVFIIICGILSVATLRLLFISIIDGTYKSSINGSEKTANTFRYDIYDRNHEAIAVTIPAVSIYLKPKYIDDKEGAIDAISTVFKDISKEDAKKLMSSNSNFVWLKRSASESDEMKLKQYGIKGIEFIDGYKRYYPFGDELASVIGITNVDNKGTSGLEYYYDKDLVSKNIEVSIDSGLQSMLYKVLIEEYIKNQADSAFGIVSNVKTGEVLAMASLPTFNPNDRSTIKGNNTGNFAIQGVYEFGSVWKFITASSALENGAELNDLYDVSKPIVVGDSVVTDFGYHSRKLTFPEVLMVSSNIGSALMAQSFGKEMQLSVLKELNLFSKSPIELPGSAEPLYRDLKKWSDANTISVSYGYGIAVSQASFLAAFNSTINGGYYRPLTLRKINDGSQVDSTKVFRDDVSRYMRGIGRLVVAKGSGSKADIKGYAIGGKTGSSEKPVNGKYDVNTVVASFVAYFPAYDPQYSVMISINEPKKNKYNRYNVLGGSVAAKATKRFLDESKIYLNLYEIKDKVYDVNKYSVPSIIKYTRSIPAVEN